MIHITTNILGNYVHFAALMTGSNGKLFLLILESTTNRPVPTARGNIKVINHLMVLNRVLDILIRGWSVFTERL